MIKYIIAGTHTCTIYLAVHSTPTQNIPPLCYQLMPELHTSLMMSMEFT
jgi:hypothetical protein